MIILMGIAGSGKSLQGKMFVDAQGYQWLSMGELFRTKLPEERKRELLTGKLVNDEEATELISNAIDGLGDLEEAVLDGFPRTIPQAEWILNQATKGKINIKAVFILKITKDVVRNRLLNRARDDDSDAIIDERFKEFETKTIPIIDFFRKNNVDVYDINADQSPDDVHKEMLSHINKG